jgi:hypothetical protein
MKLSYLILAHTNLRQVDRMINALRHEHSTFYIHFDSRVPNHEIRKHAFYDAPGVTIIRNRYKITWGGFNMVRATLSLMRAVCKKKETGYLILLSGQDFPIKSPAFIYDFLKMNYGQQYLEYFQLPDMKWSMNDGLDRIQFYWFIDSMGIDRSFELYEMQKEKDMKRPFFRNFPPYGGSQWWCITSECAAYILRFVRNNPKYEQFFEHCLIADEVFFNSVVLNSPFKENTVNDNLKFLDFEGTPHPRILTMDDWDIVTSSNKFWARKFVDGVSSDILDRLETHINEVNVQKPLTKMNTGN